MEGEKEIRCQRAHLKEGELLLQQFYNEPNWNSEDLFRRHYALTGGFLLLEDDNDDEGMQEPSEGGGG